MLIDIHIHTIYSDGRDDVGRVLKAAEQRGLGAVAITDHENLGGYYEALRLGGGLTIIPGYEVKTDAGHVLILGLEELPRLKRPVVYEELIEWVRESGGLSILAHPAVGRLRLGRWRRCPPDAVEALNAAYPLRVLMRRGLRVAYELGVPPVAGSDAHRALDVGNAYILLEDVNPDVDEVLQALRKGRHRIGGDVSPLPVRLRSGLGYLTSIIRGNPPLLRSPPLGGRERPPTSQRR